MNDSDIRYCSESIEKIVKAYSINVLTEKRFVPLFSDYATEVFSGKKIIKNVFNSTTVMEQVIIIHNTSVNGRVSEINRFKFLITDSFGLSDEWVENITAMFSQALNWGYAPADNSKKTEYKEESADVIKLERSYVFSASSDKLTDMKEGTCFLKKEMCCAGIHMIFAPVKAKKTFNIEWKLKSDDGKCLTNSSSCEGYISPQYNAYDCYWGWNTPGYWKPGKYTFSVLIDNSLRVEESFRIVDSTLKIAAAYSIYTKASAPKESIIAQTFNKNDACSAGIKIELDNVDKTQDIDLVWQIKKADGTAVSEQFKRTVSIGPGNKTVSRIWGWDTPGNWKAGDYKVSAVINGVLNAEASFQVMDYSLKISAAYSIYTKASAPKESIIAQTFNKNDACSAGIKIELDNVDKTQDIDLVWQIKKADGTAVSEQFKRTVSISPDNKTVSRIWGWDTPGNWKAGDYKVTAVINGTLNTEVSYRVVDTALAIVKSYPVYTKASDPNKPLAAKSFDVNVLCKVGIEVELTNIDKEQDINFVWQIKDAYGTSITQSLNSKISISPSRRFVNRIWGWDTPGNWKAGDYKVTAVINGTLTTETDFTVKESELRIAGSYPVCIKGALSKTAEIESVMKTDEIYTVGIKTEFCNVSAKQNIEYVWQIMNADGMPISSKYTEIDSISSRTKEVCHTYDLKPPIIWSAGNYKIKAVINGTLNTEVSFRIEESAKLKLNDLTLFAHTTKTSKQFGDSFEKDDVYNIGIISEFVNVTSPKTFDMTWQIFKSPDNTPYTKEFCNTVTLTPDNCKYECKCGWSDAGKWDVGTYEIRVTYSNTISISKIFSIVKTNVFSSSNIFNTVTTIETLKINCVRLFCGNNILPPKEMRMTYGFMFYSAYMSTVYFEVNINKLKVPQNVNVRLSINYFPFNTIADTAFTVTVPANTDNFCLQWGSNMFGSWVRGGYTFAITINGSEPITGAFSIL